MKVYSATPEEENKEIALRYKDLLKTTYQTLNEDDLKLIRKAFEIALDAHRNQRRKTGEPYIFHPIAVAKIVAIEIGLGAKGIAAALLHDVVEDCDYTHEDMRALFGESIATIVKGLTKISKLDEGTTNTNSLQLENFKKLLLTLNDDVRVILIKIADRLHNMQVMDVMPRHKQIEKASETLYIYAPLAHRLGLFNIKTKLEDLGLKYTEPDIYEEILNKITETKEEQDDYLQDFKNTIDQSFDNENITSEIKVRFKSIYSIHRKMRNQDVNFEEVYDKYAIRIIYKVKNNEVLEAWEIYTIITDHYRPMPDRLRDWIRKPRPTGYEAIHTTVMGPQEKWIEVQIRSERMNDIAERGYAAHFKYKQGDKKVNGIEDILNELKEGLEEGTLNTTDFVDGLRLTTYAKEIYVYTPDGTLKSLPKGSTALDFAFSIHTDVGLQCRGVKVNGKMTPINHELKTGDIVFIMTSNKIKPKSRWLDYVITSRAKSKIKNALKSEEKAMAEEGKAILKRKLRHLKLNYDNKTVHQIANYLNCNTSFELFYKIADGTIESSSIKNFANTKQNKLIEILKKPFETNQAPPKSFDVEEIIKKYDNIVFGDDNQKLDYKHSKCCKPLPGQNTFGIFTINEGLKIHKFNCPNAIFLRSNYSHRVISAKWIDSKNIEQIVNFKIYGIDDKGIVGEVTRIIGSLNIDLLGINFKGGTGYFEGLLKLKVKTKAQIKDLTKQLKKIEEVQKVIIL